MKKMLLISGVFLLIIGVALLGMGFLFRMSYYGTMDGDAGLYDSIFRMMIGCFAGSVISCVLGVVCLVKRGKRKG